MPDYKKKKRSRIAPARKKRVNNAEVQENIRMSPHKQGNQKTKMKVVKGKKPNYKKRFTVIGAIAAAFLLFVVIFRILHPSGVLEGLSNGIALIGTGNYPIELNGSRTIDVKTKDSYYFVLTSKQVKAFSNSGKELFSYTHGYENPVLDISQSRAIVFEQGGKSLAIFTLSGLEFTAYTESRILNADMSDSGVYALVLESEEYASAVKVYSKKGDSIYEWYSAKDIVNNVAVQYNGKRIAVSTFNAETGGFNSTVNILEFDSPTPTYTKVIENGLVYSLNSTYRSGVAVITEKEISFINWSGEETNYHSDYSVSSFRNNDGYLAVFNRENDKTDNLIVVFDSGGDVETEISFSGIIGDITLRGKHIYCISEAKVYILNFEGEIIRETSCGFGTVRTVITDSSTAVIISDSMIEKIELERE